MTTEIVSITFDGHLGAIHRPSAGPRSGLTVVISPPAGREACCAYRSLFQWAESLAARGLQVLRYDHRGEGDSLGLDPTADQWACWVAGLKQAATVARAETGAQALVLAGLRLGATLAVAAAQAIEPDGLLLLAPITTGDVYLKELRLSAAMQATAVGKDEIAVDGLRLSPATVKSLRAVDLTLLERSWRKVFLAGPDPGQEFSRVLGPASTKMPFYGYSKLFKDSYLNESPTRVLDAAAVWLEACAADVAPARSTAPAPAPRLETDRWTEEPLTFGQGMRGILCRPAREPGSRAVIFGNMGGDPRASCGGFTTHACRALAGAGIAALRFDFHGLGESADRNQGRTHVYATPRIDEYRKAASALRQQGYADLTLIGVCTGGFHAVRAVLEEGDFRRAIAFNCWLVWRPGTPLGFRAIRMKDVLHSKSWSTRFRRLAHGELHPLAKVAGLTLRLKQLWSVWWPDAACRTVRADFERASRQGKRIHIVLGQDDQAVDDMEANFGKKFRRLSRLEGLSITTKVGLDHAMYSEYSKEKAVAEIFSFMDIGSLHAMDMAAVAPEQKHVGRRKTGRAVDDPSIKDGHAASS